MYKVHKLDNGMELILINRQSMRSAAVMFCVKAGSVHEKNENAGIAHFIEHMVFRGTKNRNSLEIKKPIEEVGGSINAFTSKNLSVFYSKIPTLEIELAVDILNDLSFNAKLDEIDIEKEKKIIIEEIAMYEDDPVDMVFENLFQNIYDLDFARPVLGYRETVKKIDKNKILEYYDNYYTPSNTVAVIVGGFDEKKLINIFNNIENKIGIINNEFRSPILKEQDIIVEKKKNELSQNYIVKAFKGPSKKSKDYYACMILNILMGSGMSSLLFNTIREEESLVYEIASDYNAYLDSGLFLLFAATTTENLNNYNLKLDEIISNFSKRDDLNNWFNYGKKRLIGKLTIDIESNLAMGMNALDLYLTYNKIVTIDDVIKEINKVTLNDVISISNKIFKGNKYISTLNPGN